MSVIARPTVNPDGSIMSHAPSVDTNVLIYASRPLDPLSAPATARLEAAEDAEDELCISRQVMRE